MTQLFPVDLTFYSSKNQNNHFVLTNRHASSIEIMTSFLFFKIFLEDMSIFVGPLILLLWTSSDVSSP